MYGSDSVASQVHSGVGHNINAGGNVYLGVTTQHLSLLSSVINAIGRNIFDESSDELDVKSSFDIEDKIDYNCINTFRDIIDEYRIYVGKLSALYREYDSNGLNKTNAVLRSIRLSYLKVKAEYVAKSPQTAPIEVVKLNADNIIADVEARLLDDITRSTNITEPIETVRECLQVVLIDALMKCKILEKPPKTHAIT